MTKIEWINVSGQKTLIIYDDGAGVTLPVGPTQVSRHSMAFRKTSSLSICRYTVEKIFGYTLMEFSNRPP